MKKIFLIIVVSCLSVILYSQEIIIVDTVVSEPTERSYFVEWFDKENDGDKDLIIYNLDDQAIKWYENDGYNQFTEIQIVSTTSPSGIYPPFDIGDLNGDGYEDIVFLDYNSNGRWEIRYTMNSGNNNIFSVDSLIADTILYQNDYSDIKIADLTGDGKGEILFANGTNFFVFSNSNGYVSHDWRTNDSTEKYKNIEIVDWDFDGDLDVITGGNGKGVLHINSTNLGAKSDTQLTNVGSHLFEPLDIDGDNDMDIVYLMGGFLIHTWINDGSNNFTVTNTGIYGQNFTIKEDFNNDGLKDVLIKVPTANNPQPLKILLNNNSSFSLSDTLATDIPQNLSVDGFDVTDIDGDNKSDFALVGRGVFISKLCEKPHINAQGITLISSEQSGNQWYLDNTLLVNETNDTLIAQQNGNYVVKVNSQTNCGLASDAVSVTQVSINELNQDRIAFYPVPFKEELFFSSDEPIAIERVVNSLGQALSFSKKTNSIKVHSNYKGPLFIQYRLGNGLRKSKFILKN